MNEGLHSVDWDVRLKMQAWTYSLILHALFIGLALLLSTSLTLPPPNDPFRWDVALVEPAPSKESPAPQPAAAVEPPPKPAPRTPSPTVRPMPQPTPVERHIETATQPIVQQVETRRQEQVLERKVATTEAPQPTEHTAEVRPSTHEVKPVTAPAPSIVERPAQVIAADPSPAERVVATAPVETAAAQPTEEVVRRVEVNHQSSPVVERTEQTVTEPALTQIVHQPTQAPTVVQTPTTIDRSPEPPTVNHSVPREAEHPMIAKAPPVSAPASRPDYSWLTDLLQRRSAEVRHYPSQARLNQWQGKVILRAVIRADGHLADVTVKKSSGHSILDEAAMDVIRRITPIPLKYALGRQEVVVNIPISYELN